MSDMLLTVGGHPMGRKLFGSLGLPLPQPLVRARGPWAARPLEGRSFALGGPPDSRLSAALRGVVVAAGARETTSTSDDAPRIGLLVFDATEVSRVADLRALYDFLHPRIGRLDRSGRVLVVGRPVTGDAEAASARAALVGFTKSVAKEVGRKGATANLLTVAEGGEAFVEGPVRYLLSPRSAFVSGQALHVGPGRTGAALWTRPLAGKVAVVTGAARGIGEATARRLAEEGARVLCLDIPGDTDRLGALSQSIGAVPVPLDITSEGAAAALLEAAGGPLDVIVHNAGITRDRTLGRMPEQSWDQALAVNLGAVVAVTERLLATGGVCDKGRVILVSSVAGIAGNVGQTNYAASKAGILGLVAALAPRLEDRGITVNAVAPGFIETRLTAAIPFAIRQAGRRLSNLSQGGLPVDVAEAITFLASPGAAGVTGTVLRVCGGSLLGA